MGVWGWGAFVLLHFLLVPVRGGCGDLMVEECPPLGRSPRARSQTATAADVIRTRHYEARHLCHASRLWALFPLSLMLMLILLLVASCL